MDWLKLWVYRCYMFRKDDGEADRLNQAVDNADSKVELYHDYNCTDWIKDAEVKLEQAKAREAEYWKNKSKWKLW